MHKGIKVFLSVIAAVSIVIISAPYAISLSGLDKRIAGYVVDHLTEDSDQIIQIGDVDLNYQALKLSNIRFFSNSSHLNLVLNDLRVEYNIFTLLGNTQKPQLAVTKIYFIEPDITYRESGATEPDSSQHEAATIRIDHIFDQFEHIGRIHIQEGRVNFMHESGELIPLASNLNGWFFGGDSSALQLHAIGDLLNAEEPNFSLDCTFDPVHSRFSAQVELMSFDLRSSRFVYQDSTVSLLDGRLEGALNLDAHALDPDSMKVNGNLSVRNGRARFYGIDLDDLNMHLKVADNQLEITDATVRSDSSHLAITGSVRNIFQPKLTGHIYSTDLDVAHFSDLLAVPVLSGVKFSLDTQIEVSREGLLMAGSFSAPKIYLKSQEINNLNTQFTLKNSELRINALSFETLSFNFLTDVQFNLNSGDFTGSCFATRLQGDNLILDRISNAEQSLYMNFKGNIPNMEYSGEWAYQINKSADTLFSVRGRTTLEDGDFQFSNYQKSDDDFLITIRIKDLLKDPSISYGYISNPPVSQLTDHEWLINIAKNNLLEAVMSGSLNDLNLQLAAKERKHPEREFNFNAHVLDLLMPEKRITGDLVFNRFDSEYEFRFGDGYLRGTIQSNSSLKGVLDIDVNRDEQIRSMVEFTGLNPNEFLNKDVLNEEAAVNGLISIRGDMADPEYQVRLQGDRFIISDVGYYRFNIALDSQNRNLAIDTLGITLNNKPVLNGSGMLDFASQIVDLHASGAGLDAESISRTIFSGKDLLKGVADYTVGMSGPLSAPQINSTIRLKDGDVEGILFDQIDLALSDSLTGNSFFQARNHLVNINKLLAVKAGQYHLEVNGNFPLYDNGRIDLKLAFDGDAFSFLPRADKVFADGACFSSINLQVTGTPGNLRITEGLINIDRGELWLNSVAEHIQNIHGRIELAKGSNNVTIKDFRGEVDGRPLMINTVEDVTTSDGKKLQHWYFKSLDLDFGILALETPEDGIRVQIPGFMLENELGNIALRGKTPSEKFYFAGPAKKPYAWGKVIYSDSRFTFPFNSEGDEEPTPVVQFLASVFWDVDIYPGTNLEYVRTIPAFLGRVDTEVSVDAAEDGLHVEGVIADKSFRAEGELYSTRGRVDYLDLNFRVDNFSVRFNPNEDKPEVSGRAWTTVRDSVGAIPKTIYLELYAIDRETGEETVRSRWDDFRFRLVSADPTIGETQEQVLAYLGYSVDNIKEKATEVGGAVTDNYIIRPLLRPIERRLENYFGMDLVRFNSGIAKNLFQASFGQGSKKSDLYGTPIYQDNLAPYALLLESSELTVGKYLSKDLYLTYTGQIVATALDNQNQFNFNHMVGLEYRFYKNLLLEFEYYREALQFNNIYTEKSYLEDFKIRLRHSFAF
jgi:hypothetical protein